MKQVILSLLEERTSSIIPNKPPKLQEGLRALHFRSKTYVWVATQVLVDFNALLDEKFLKTIGNIFFWICRRYLRVFVNEFGHLICLVRSSSPIVSHW